MLRLVTFGGLALEPDNGTPAPRLRPPRLALLAVLAAAGDRGVSRERLMGLFWPDADEPRARHSLRQARYSLHNELKSDVVQTTGSTLRLEPGAITADVLEFHDALAAGDRARAVSLVRGPFLDGFYLNGASGFERWVEDERARLAATTTAALLALATDAAGSGEHDAAVEWWRQLTAVDPLSGRFAIGYLKALASRGDRAAALAFARQHEAIVRRELEADADPDVRRLEAELRSTTVAMGASPSAEPAATPDAGLGSDTELAQAPVSVPARSSRRHGMLGIGIAAALLLVLTAAFAQRHRWLRSPDADPTLAVGFIETEGIADSLGMGPVLTDMLATSLARVQGEAGGLKVLANSRILELVRPGATSGAAYFDAARRAGASEVLEGRVRMARHATLTLDVRRVEVRTGIVRGVYRVNAADQYALVDSLTNAIAGAFRLSSPQSSIAAATTSSPMAYRLYEEGLRAFFQFDNKGAYRLMHAALEDDSTFAMAAFYEAMAAGELGRPPDGRDMAEVRRTALRLASRAPERERLMITANLLFEDHEPRSFAVAESLATRYPDDPRALVTLSKVRWRRGDWTGAAAAAERAIVLDSIGEPKGRPNCLLCRDYAQLAEVYFWWDSLSAVERTVRRYQSTRPESGEPLYSLSLVHARRGDSAAAYAAFRRMSASGGDNRHLKFRLDLLVGAYESVENDAKSMLASASPQDWSTAAWMLLIALRNEGRIRDATQFNNTGTLAGYPTPTVERTPDRTNEAILALERGDARQAAAVFGRSARDQYADYGTGFRSRWLAWNGALRGMALAAAGDTLALRRLADSVEVWGAGSAYGRDQKAHHYLRGLLLGAAGKHAEAAQAFRAAVHSTSLGFTRVNYELGRCYLQLGRAGDAVAILQPALRGEVDASNLYVTRTDLHELLAQAFDAAGQRDSAAVHYRAVVAAWRNADPAFHARRDRAATWLAHQARR